MSQSEDEPHGGRKYLINQKEKRGRDKYHYEDHRGGHDRLLAARPSDPRDLLTDLLNKLDWTRFRHNC